MKRSIHMPTRKEMLQAFAYVAFAFALIFLCATFQECRAQSVTHQGKLFIQNPSSSTIKKDSITLTGYYYVTSDGTRYPIYKSSKGKCFIFRISAKTGKQYKQYLPEITKQLSNGRK